MTPQLISIYCYVCYSNFPWCERGLILCGKQQKKIRTLGFYDYSCIKKEINDIAKYAPGKKNVSPRMSAMYAKLFIYTF